MTTIIAVACLVATKSLAIEIARDGRSACVIVLPENPSPVERSAARELRDHLRHVTGAALPIASASDVNADSRQIAIRSEDGLARDAIAIKADDKTLHLTGSSPRGPLYAVYAFLEDHVGVRWWTSTESFILSKPTLIIGHIDFTYTPPFRYREVFHKDAMANPAFAARLKLNGHHHPIPTDLGGHYSILGWCHTSFDLVPPAQYFAAHPEWYAQIDGQRQASTQLCLSNADMRRELIRNALKRVRKNPDAGIISISQNDGFGPCQCDACQAIATEEGSESGPWMRLGNEAAAEINKEFPGFLVETLAYVYSRKPPKITRPSKNVLVRLCSIECDFTKPLSSEWNEWNRAFADDLRQWRQIAPNLFIWNYVTNFTNYLIPHPNMPPLDDDLRFFAENNVVGVFQQGDCFNQTGDFLALRTWVHAKLLWSPSLDVLALRDEFLKGYYGAAAPHLARYLALLDKKANDPKLRLRCYNPAPDFLTDDDIAAATRCFDDAARSVADEAELTRRIQRERIVLDHVRLLRYDFAATDPDLRANYQNAVRIWANDARRFGVSELGEGSGLSAYVPILLARVDRFLQPETPRAGVELPAGQLDIQEDHFRLQADFVQLVDDPAASNGRAARMIGGHTNWSIQFPVPENLTGPGPWECHLLVRVESDKKQGKGFLYGLHNSANNTYIAIDRVSLPATSTDEYRAYGLVVDELKPTMYFWLAPPAGQHIKAVYLDRIFFQRQAK